MAKEGEMESIPIKCSKCGKVTSVTAGEGHTGILKCDCGATTTIKGKPFDLLADLQKMIPELISQWKTEKRKGIESGLDEALHETAKEMAMQLLRDNPDFKAAMFDFVYDSLKQAFRITEDGEPE